jgi:hypothetical protein
VPEPLRAQVLEQLRGQLKDGRLEPIILRADGAAVRPAWLAALGVAVVISLALVYLMAFVR